MRDEHLRGEEREKHAVRNETRATERDLSRDLQEESAALLRARPLRDRRTNAAASDGCRMQKRAAAPRRHVHRRALVLATVVVHVANARTKCGLRRRASRPSICDGLDAGRARHCRRRRPGSGKTTHGDAATF